MYSHECSLGYGCSSTLKVGCCSHQHLWSIPNACCLFRIHAPRTICITWRTTCVELLSSHHYPPAAFISFFFYDYSTSMQHRVMVQSAGTAFRVQSDIPTNSYWIALSHLTHMLPSWCPTGSSSDVLWMTLAGKHLHQCLRDQIFSPSWWFQEHRILKHQSSSMFSL